MILLIKSDFAVWPISSFIWSETENKQLKYEYKLKFKYKLKYEYKLKFKYKLKFIFKKMSLWNTMCIWEMSHPGWGHPGVTGSR